MHGVRMCPKKVDTRAKMMHENSNISLVQAPFKPLAPNACIHSNDCACQQTKMTRCATALNVKESPRHGGKGENVEGVSGLTDTQPARAMQHSQSSRSATPEQSYGPRGSGDTKKVLFFCIPQPKECLICCPLNGHTNQNGELI